MPKDLAMPIETLIGQSVRPRSCRAEPAAPRQMPAAAKRSGRRQGEGLPTPVKMADRSLTRYRPCAFCIDVSFRGRQNRAMCCCTAERWLRVVGSRGRDP